MKKQIIGYLLVMATLVACNSGGNSINYPGTPTNMVGPSDDYQCLPSGLPGDSNGLKIAYSSECKVADVTKNNIKSSLESMAIAITYSSGERYCSGTPLSYNSSTGYGYVLTAAHCVIADKSKASGVAVTASNIGTFAKSMNYVNQTLNASSRSGVTGEITAVYIPQQYCKDSSITLNAKSNTYACSNIPAQNGDVALLRVNYNRSTVVKLDPNVELASDSLTMPYPSYIMALGYGKTNPNSNNTNLFYITYEYFGTNSYMGVTGQSVIMNGYSTNNAFYNIICNGDSGGGDFYWNENSSKWSLVGVHSYGSGTCGIASSLYGYAMDASADVRPFTNKLYDLMTSTSSGCDSAKAAANGFICADK